VGSFNKIFIIFIMFLLAVSSEAASLFHSLSFQDQKKWVQLLHYENGGLEAKTLIDEPQFFVSPLGHKNPIAELDAFLAEYQNPKEKYGRLKLSLPCAYPARTAFLIDLGVIKKTHQCPDFDLWRKEVNPEAISIVFSTAYPNNPASMFGHTFLRFHKKGKTSDLLDYGANYSALTDGDDSGFMYAMKGIFGGYKGYFDLAPYYIKLNEYIYGENRDLIEYELNLSQKQVDFLLAHLWELYQGASFDYYFTEENCSFHLASLLNVVLPSPLPYIDRWYYLPSDLIFQIKKTPGLIRKILDRPSRLRVVKSSLNDLTKIERKNVDASLRSKNSKNLNLKEKKSLVGILNYLKFKQKNKFPEKNKKLLRETLVSISKDKTEEGKAFQSPPFKNRPDLAHAPQRVSLGIGRQENQTIINMGVRSGYHDLLAKDIGMEPFSQFRFLGFEGQYFVKDQKMRVKELLIMDIASFFPLHSYERQISWKVGGRFEDMPEYGSCAQCWRFITEGKVGASLGNRAWLFGILMGGVLEASPRYRRGHKENLAYEVILGKTIEFDQDKELKVLSTFEGLHNIRHLKKDIRSLFKLGLNYSWNQNWEMRLKASLPLISSNYNLQGERFELQLAHYF
jgi:hypothetical protein